jgi:arsenate reductase
MSNVKIYHNPRCSKSRQALQIIKDHGIEPEVIEYLKEPLGKKELERIAKSL